MLSTQTILQHFYDDDERVCQALDVYVYVGSYVIPASGVRGNGARLAMVGHGRDVANAKYSNWVRLVCCVFCLFGKKIEGKKRNLCCIC